WVGHVARDPEVDLGEATVEAGQGDGGRRQVDRGAEGAEDARAAVGGGAAADAKGDRADAVVEHGPEDLSRAEGGGPHRVTLRGGQSRQPGCFGKLDNGAAPVGQAQPARVERPADGVRCGRGPPFPAAGGLDGHERALAPVGQRREQDLVVRPRLVPAAGEGRRDLHRGQRTLERVGRDDDPHYPTSVSLSSPWRRSRYSGIRTIGGRSMSASSMTSSESRPRPERGSFIVEPSSAKSRALRRSSSRFMTACRITKLIRESPSSSWLRWTRRSRSTWPSPSR